MGARITNFPTFVVVDRSKDFTLTTTTTTGAITTTTGTPALIYDRDISTAFQTDTTKGTTIDDYSCVNLLDWGRVYYNNQMFLKVELSQTNTGLNGWSYAIERSINGTDWVSITSGSTLRNTQVNYEATTNFFGIRYLKTTITQAWDVGTHLLTTKIYEQSLMGSN